jgi:hypothetical protein
VDYGEDGGILRSGASRRLVVDARAQIQPSKLTAASWRFIHDVVSGYYRTRRRREQDQLLKELLEYIGLCDRVDWLSMSAEDMMAWLNERAEEAARKEGLQG